MSSPVPTEASRLLLSGFVATLIVWIGLSTFVVINRLLYDRRERRLIGIARELSNPSLMALPNGDRSPSIRRILAGLTRRAVYRMIASTSLPTTVTEMCAAYALDRWGLSQMIRDAAAHRRRRKWRRISALFAVGHIRAAEAHDLLGAAVFDPDPEVADAAIVVLHRLGDRPAAEILVAALRRGTFSRSRIATQLDQFPIAIDDLLRPLLADPQSRVRYWATSLLARYARVPGLAAEIVALTKDSNPPVRKAAIETLGAMSDSVAIPVAVGMLDDSVAYVRSAAISTIARHGALALDPARRRALAASIAPSMADAEWEVRLSAKESLVALGPSTWREVAVHLESSDAFARNGAAEVLQNLGLLDRTVGELGRGGTPSAELVNVLALAFHEGGVPMIDAVVARATADPMQAIDNLLTELRFVGATP